METQNSTAGRLEPQSTLRDSIALFRFILRVIHWFMAITNAIRAVYRQIVNLFYTIIRFHYRTPQLVRSDVSALEKVPRHISVILNIRGPHQAGAGIQGLLNDISQLAAWSIGSGASVLTIYERSGALVNLPPLDVLKAINIGLREYFGDDTPQVSVGVPSARQTVGDENNAVLSIHLISEADGRPRIVELAREFVAQAASKEITPEEITIEKVDQVLTERVGTEPDLLIMFTPKLDLQGYPPWHIRVTEMFYLRDNTLGVSYYVFYRALAKFSSVKINLGK